MTIPELAKHFLTSAIELSKTKIRAKMVGESTPAIRKFARSTVDRNLRLYDVSACTLLAELLENMREYRQNFFNDWSSREEAFSVLYPVFDSMIATVAARYKTAARLQDVELNRARRDIRERVSKAQSDERAPNDTVYDAFKRTVETGKRNALARDESAKEDNAKFWRDVFVNERTRLANEEAERTRLAALEEFKAKQAEAKREDEARVKAAESERRAEKEAAIAEAAANKAAAIKWAADVARREAEEAAELERIAAEYAAEDTAKEKARKDAEAKATADRWERERPMREARAKAEKKRAEEKLLEEARVANTRREQEKRALEEAERFAYETRWRASLANYDRELVEVLPGTGHLSYEHWWSEKIRTTYGIVCRTVARSGDQGADLIFPWQGRSVLIQAKRYAAKVGNKIVRETKGSAEYWKCKEAWVVTTLGFTPKAFEYARETSVLLVAGDPTAFLDNYFGADRKAA